MYKLIKSSVVLLILFIFVKIFVEFQDTETTHKYSKIRPSYLQTSNISSSIENSIFEVTKPQFSILFWTDTWHAVQVEKFFESLHGCGEEFQISSNRADYDQSDVIIFDYHELNEGLRNGTMTMPSYRIPDVPWVLAIQESSIRTKPLETSAYDGAFNFTWGYRSDADIHTEFVEMYDKYEQPDEKWIYGSQFSLNFLRNKTKLATWVVSNCNSISSKRDQFVNELAAHGISVDIYGKCGRPFQGIGIDGNWRDSDSFAELGKQYKFYMSMENSLCIDYITEKPDHGWSQNMVPIIYALGNKELVAPPGSYIDAMEFETIEDLADYIKFLDENPKEYFKYFEWKSVYNISSSFHSRAHCYAWEKIRNLTMKLRNSDDDTRNKHVNRDLELWRSFFYNSELDMHCKNCLKSYQVNITHPKQNKLRLYTKENCLPRRSVWKTQDESESWY